MNCTINDLNLSFDKDNRLRTTIGRVTGWNIDKAYVLASLLQDSKFKSYLSKHLNAKDILSGANVDLNNIQDSDYVNINQNKLGSILNAYYLDTYHNINNSKTNKAFGQLVGFSSSTAKKLAKDYTADLLIDEYFKELNKVNRRDYKEIVKLVIDKLNTDFIKNATDFANSILATNKYSKEAKDYAQKLIDLIDKGTKLKDQTNELVIKCKLLKKQIELYEGKSISKEDKIKYDKYIKEFNKYNTQYKDNVKELNNIKFDRYIMCQNLINLYTTNIDGALKDRLRNFANLISQVNGNTDAWFTQVFTTKKMTDIAKNFDKIGSIEEFMEEEDSNEDNYESKYNDETYDETAKTWEDSSYKNFNQGVGTKMKMILSRIHKLASPYNEDSTAQTIDDNNELGVLTYMDPQYLTVQLFSFRNISSVEDMINSINKKAKSVRELYGLGYLVSQMKKDKVLANYVYCNFAKPLIHKCMVNVSDISDPNGIKFDYSNNNAFYQTKITFDMMNKLRATYNTNYNVEDLNILSTANKDITNKEKRDKAVEVIIKYFPNFDNELFDNIFTSENGNDKFKTIITNTYNMIKEVGKLKDKINADIEKINTKFINDKNTYNNKLKLFLANKTTEAPIYPTKETLNLSTYKFSSSLNKAIINISNIISESTDSRARLNTANATGNSSADIGKNCYVTRFFEQILSESEEDSNAGLRQLGNYLIQGTDNNKENQYSNNPLFFGLKDINGVVLVSGMFTKTKDGFIINNNAKQILKYALFDGAKNTHTNNGVTYSEMSKLDFFITQYVAFNNSIEELVDGNLTNQINGVDTAVYPMRIGSDAPKIYMIKAPKYNNTQAKYAIYNHLMDEFNLFVTSINNLFVLEENGQYKTKTNLDGLIGRAYFNERTASKLRSKNKTDSIDFTPAIVDKIKDNNGEHLELVGNMFSFKRLFKLDNYNADAKLKSLLSLYGRNNKSLFIEDATGRIAINNEYINNENSFIKLVDGRFVLDFNENLKKEIFNIVNEWSNNYIVEANNILKDYIKVIQEQNLNYNINNLNSFILNSTVMNMNYDDLFEGDFKYYNNARDFLKRTKETQAGGDSYSGFNLNDIHNELVNLKWNNKEEYITIKQKATEEETTYNIPTYVNGKIVDSPMIARNGWRAVTIYNTLKASDVASDIQEQLESIFIKNGMTKENAHNRAVKIAEGYFSNTKINDAQSYITLEEFIRRKYANGTINEYKDLIAQLLDPDIPAETINLDEINSRIQVEKNFYFDKVFDPITNQFYPRQIKNAEFVLIPKLLPKDSDLYKVYEWMKANDIGQLNTAETDKAAKKNIFTIWDEQTGEFNPDFSSNFDERYIQNYYYEYLYKQQDVPQHMQDTRNKFGTQINKKIIDNISTAPKEIQKAAEEYLDAWSRNIEEDFYMFLDNMNWELDNNGKIVNKNYATTDAFGNRLSEETIEYNRTKLNLNNYYAKAREEAIRLGMDSNFMEYLIPDEFGNPKMPNVMNSIMFKLESVAQSIINRNVTRQVLPGWHAAQITRVGTSTRLSFDAKTGTMEVLLPRWSKLISKGKTKEENDRILKQIEEQGLDIHIGYRIPTEGKQSVAVLKVVGFVNDALGSTIVVPDEWVTQTGSDFDVDSVYGICYEMYSKKDRNGNIKVYKIPCEENEVNDKDLYINYINRNLEEKLKRDDISSNIKESINKLKIDIYNINKNKLDQLSNAYTELNNNRDKLYNDLPKWAQDIIKTANSRIKKLNKNKSAVTNIEEAYPIINNLLSAYIENNKVSENETNIINEYIDYQLGIIDIFDQQKDILIANKEEYKSSKSKIILETIEKAKNDYIIKLNAEAIKYGLLTFSEFSKQPHVNKLSRKARNNYILNRMITIMKDSSSREEQYGRSQFEDIVNGDKTGANDVVNKLYGEANRSRSPYNPLDQLDYFDDAMGGARLKAISVNWDTLTSKCNRMQVELDENSSVDVVLKLDDKSAIESQIKYNKEEIKKSYKDDIISNNENKINIINNNINDTELKNNYVGYINMNMIYNNEKRDDVKSTNTYDAIKTRERTATTRYKKDGYLNYITNFKIGDIIEIRKTGKPSIYVKITKVGYLPKNTSAEEWSKKEGWNVEHFNRVVKPEIEKGEAYQIEFKYISSQNVSSRKINNINIDNKNTITLKARKLGWSANNRNIVGNLVTTYTAETTAHHLDAVKEGSIPNVNEYTFDVYKLLSCLGLDFEIAVGFIRQPIITRLVNNYNLTNSVFFGSNDKPIDMTFRDLAIDLNLAYTDKYGRTKAISSDTNKGIVFKAFINNDEFVNAFRETFNIDLSTIDVKDINNINIPIRKDYIFKRIQTAGKNKTASINSNNKNAYYQAAFDFGMLIKFSQLQKITKDINNIIQFSNIDKVGAKPSIRETRKIVDLVEKYRNNLTLQKNGISFADLLYPKNSDRPDDINIEKSLYKSIATVYKYVTTKSSQIGGEMFINENEDFVNAEKYIENIIKHSFNETEYKDYKRYSMAYMYNQLSIILKPLTVNERGQIIEYISENEENNTELKTAISYWDAERSRIVGYGITNESNFTCENINNPTKEEINEFIKLTPAQKVLFMQRNFPDGQGIFNYIKITLLNPNDIKTKGLSRQYLAYDDQVDSIEDLYEFFINSFSNKNPLIKLSAVDLIKYAFVAEGFNFKNGYITKTVPNSVLYNSTENGGMDIIEPIRKLVKDLPSTITEREFIDLYMRSHSEIAPLYVLKDMPPKKIDKYTGVEINAYENATSLFNRCTNADKLVTFNATLDNFELKNLIANLGLQYRNGGYIRINVPDSNNVRSTILYRVECRNEVKIGDKTIYNDIYLIPLNLLDKNETYNVSYNQNYNIFNDTQYYDDRIYDLYRITQAYRIKYPNKQEKASTFALKKVPAKVNEIGKFGQEETIFNDPLGLMKAYNSGDKFIKGGARMLLDDIRTYIIPDVIKGDYTGKYLLNQNYKINYLLPINTYTEQIIEDNEGNRYNITIAHVANDYKRINTINKIMEGKLENNEYDYAIKRMKDTKTSPQKAILYRVTFSKITEEENKENIRFASTDLISDEPDNITLNQPARRGTSIDRVSASIIKQINYDAVKNNNKIARQFINTIERKGINRNYTESLMNNRENIYKAAARYYKSSANKLINSINSFVIDGIEYKMNDPKMYEALAEHDEYFAEVSKIILDATTFGNRISPILELDLSAEDKETKEAVESIIKSIQSIRNNTNVKAAMTNLINIYFKKYSTNPMITEGLMNIRDQFGDIDTIVSFIADPAELNNPEVQIILKQIYTMFNKAELFDAKRNVEEWENKLAKIDAMEDTMDINKIIDYNKWMLKPDYNSDYLKDKQKIIDRLNEAIANRFNSIKDFGDYLKAKYDRDKFMYENVEQPIINKYYEEELAISYNAINIGRESFFEYMMLSSELYRPDYIDESKEENIERKNRIKSRMNYLKSEIEIDGSEKDFIKQKQARAINEYIEKRRELKNKYFDKQEYEGFRNDFNRYNNFITRYNNEHPSQTLAEKLENNDYREAYEWIKSNSRKVFSDELNKKLKEAFKVLNNNTVPINKKILYNIKQIPGAIDEAGIINPLVLTNEQLALVKESEINDMSRIYLEGIGELMLIKDIPANIPIMKKVNNKKTYEINPNKLKTIEKINKIIGKAVNYNTGKLEVDTLFNDNYVTNEEREELISLYDDLRQMNKKEEALFGHIGKEKRFFKDYNWDAYYVAKNYYDTIPKNSKQAKQWIKIFTQFDENNNVVPNEFIYGFKNPFEDYIDTEKTEAVEFIKNNVDFVKTEYYYTARDKAIKEGKYDEWFELNHNYNIYTHKYEPLKIWTTIEAKPESDLAKSVKYVPTFDNFEYNIKDEFINNEYKEFNSNFKNTSKYATNIKLNKKEQALKKLIQNTLNKYATTYKGKQFVNKGYLPRERSTQIDTRWALSQVAMMFGASWYSGAESDAFYDVIDYSHDKEADMKMLQLTKSKGTKDYKKLPNKSEYSSEEEYLKALQEVREENRKITEENIKIDNANVNKDWRNVMKDFVYNATIFNSRQAMKPYMYLLLEDLKDNNAYIINGIWNKNLIKDKDSSTKDNIQYKTEKQTRTYEVVHNLARRLFYEQYHKNNVPRSIANFLQNLTSAKYMIFNLYGGISNITTGLTNVAMEEYANEYFGFKEFAEAEKEYMMNSKDFIASMFKDKSTSLTVAICKEFNIVDFDQILQFSASAENLDTKIKNIRNALYSFQSIGEHFMQNSVLLAMLKSNRIYTDTKGILRIGDFKDFTNNIEEEAMRITLANNQNLFSNYDTYIKSIEYNLNDKLDISTGRSNINRNFLNSIKYQEGSSSNTYKIIANNYINKRKELMDKAKERFLENPTVESIYEFKNGQATIKNEIYDIYKDKKMVGDFETLIAGFKEKVKKVNTKIHGVYDKNGAAMIENKWFGSLVMQYHKHLPTGIWKRWRRKGYYSEFRGSMERGTYQSLIDFLGTEFINFKDNVNSKKLNGTNVALASVQTAMETIINSITNIQFNWNMLSPWEQRNIRRNLGDMTGVLVACAIALALYGLYDDDDIKDDKFKSSLLYLADRLYSDSTMYSPIGLVTESKTAWSSPIASANGPSDLIKIMQLIPQALFDPDYNPDYETGLYAGQNKILVRLRRNIPGIRPWDRIQMITRNNDYYKIDSSQIGISIAKSFGEMLNE